MRNQHNVCLLIKGQDLDLQYNSVQLVKERFPKENHQIIFLDVDLHTIFERCTHKFWWSDTITFPDFKGWLEEQIDYLTELSSVITITTLQSIEGEYTLGKFPPELN